MLNIVDSTIPNITGCAHQRTACCGVALTGEHWQQCKDEQGRVKHVVELQTENAQEVLDALQSAVFTGKLPACSYKVRPAQSLPAWQGGGCITL
jgi:hypothetical protein